MPPRIRKEDASIIALDKFIQATRDSGYKGTASAVSELVDNSLQAGATAIAIDVARAESGGLEVSVLDNGCGMDPFTLRQALRFGGSTRFGNRDGLGRYGMGLPNSSLSQAKRVTVYTWQSPGRGSRSARGPRDAQPQQVFWSYLDVAEIVRADMTEVPSPKRAKTPPALCRGGSGTLVVWSDCDRLDHQRASTITKKLARELGRRFRHFIWRGVLIAINGNAVQGIDPLCLHPDSEVTGAQLFGDETEYEVRVDADSKATGRVRVRFSELPVHEWHKLSNEEKRRIGISKGAGVSVIRAGREVDYGWFFMGTKRRENYDDWWRCEIHFDPVLDEAFGVTHTKQQVRPMPHVLEALVPDIEATARALNTRARRAHLAVRTGERFSDAERVAAGRDRVLKPLPMVPLPGARELMAQLKKKHPSLNEPRAGETKEREYRIIESPVRDTSFFNWAVDDGQFVLVLNPEHPFFREIYKPLAEGDTPRDQQLRSKLELMLLAAARAEACCKSSSTAEKLAEQRREWSNTLATFLNG